MFTLTDNFVVHIIKLTVFSTVGRGNLLVVSISHQYVRNDFRCKQPVIKQLLRFYIAFPFSSVVRIILQ